ncbi:FERM domain-containing protein 3 [Fasciolopsis buskii]|uniref:FERM domain-containing protein 3 n=1 Tax=Fasciolopsis buskii TaxID=27845 RepID=A0A8E0VHV9_9TREM|nr:FERM domain-containing protein 3 [Fasciolopsis buski]
MRSIKKLVVKGGNQVLENEPQSSPQTSSKGSQKRKNSEKEITCKIRLLDDAQIPLELSVRKSELGKRIFTYVCDAIGDLVECDYFGLRYKDRHDQSQWLDLDRSVYKQMKGCKNFHLSFRVKHYPSDPISDLKQDLTRYLLYLQIRRDLAQGRLLCPPNVVGRIGALVAQAELGDAPESDSTANMSELAETASTPNDTSGGEATIYSPNTTTDTSEPKSISTTPESVEKAEKIPQTNNYLHNLKIIVKQTPKVEAEIMKEHKILRGITAQEAETELLSRASQLVTYGIDPFTVRPLHKVIIPNVNTTQSTNEAGDQVRTEKSMSPAQNAKTVSDVPVYLPKGTAFFMGITGTGLVTFVGLHRSQEYHWNQIQRVGCDGERFVVYLKKEEPKTGKRLFRNKTNVLTFQCESKAAALALWHWTVDRKCFFTLKQASEAKRLRPTSNIFQRSHTYRFSGRSHQELTSIPIRNTKNDFVRVSSLRRVIGSYTSGDSSASFGRATLPSRLRPPLELCEETRPCEVIEPPKEPLTSTENVKPVIIPDTVIEQPLEEDSATAVITEHKVEENKIDEPVQQPQIIEPDVVEPEIQATEMPQQLTTAKPIESKPETESLTRVTEPKKIEAETDLRKRVTNSLSQASTFQQVVSALDQTIEKHTEPKDKHLVGPTGNGTKQITSPNGEVHKVTTSNTYQNGPITTKITQIYSRKVVSETRKAASEEVEEISEADFEKSHYDATVVKMAVTAMTVVFLVGLVVFLETPPAADATIHRFMRSNVFVNTFDQYIYSPIRNVIVAGLSALWS